MRFFLAFVAVVFFGRAASCDDGAGDPERGYRLLLEKEFLPPDFDAETFDSVWEVWPAALREQAAEATPEERRAMAFERYGLTTRPGDTSGKPLQYVVDAEGNWTMNCFSCHGGSVYGQPLPGAPNRKFALQTMTEEIRARKLQTGKTLTRMDLGAMFIPLGTTHGTTNAVAFGVAVMHYRDNDMNVIQGKGPPNATHHDMDAPPWWHFHKKSHIYIDGFAQKSHRALMQFMLVRENSAAAIYGWEEDFRHIYAYLMSLRPPQYGGPIDERLAEQGEELFVDNCSECHGTYGKSWTYPERRVALEDIGTDPVRLTALSAAGRQHYADSWLAHYGSEETIIQPDGYVAPPLDGIWASAPYLHNGSVPTLWHVLHPEQRPAVWRPTSDDLDHDRVGLHIEEVDSVPLTEEDRAVRRTYFDTRQFGKSAAGHEYPNALTEPEKDAVLEYLKTL